MKNVDLFWNFIQKLVKSIKRVFKRKSKKIKGEKKMPKKNLCEPSSSKALSSSVSVDLDLPPSVSLRFFAAFRRRTLFDKKIKFIEIIYQ